MYQERNLFNAFHHKFLLYDRLKSSSSVHALACRYLLTSACGRQGTPPSKNCTKLLQAYFVYHVKVEGLFMCIPFVEMASGGSSSVSILGEHTC